MEEIIPPPLVVVVEEVVWDPATPVMVAAAVPVGVDWAIYELCLVMWIPHVIQMK
jgi:hypothetical protein